MSKSRVDDKIRYGGDLPVVKVTAKPLTRQDSTAVGARVQSKADVARAVSELNKAPNTAVGSPTNLGGRNETTDNINAMIERRKRLTGGRQ